MTTNHEILPQTTEQHSTNDERELAFWYGLISESAAANFLGVEPRTMQGYRQRGDGPAYIRLSFRCIRYRRIDLKEWAEKRRRTSTSQESAIEITAPEKWVSEPRAPIRVSRHARRDETRS